MEQFYKYSRPGICALTSGQKVYIFASANLLNYVASLIKDNTVYKDWSSAIIETWDHYDIIESQLLLAAAYRKYESDGYVVVNKNPRLVKFKVVRVMEDGVVCVYLKNRYQSKLVGRFENIETAQLFIDKHYAPGYTKIIESGIYDDIICDTINTVGYV